MTHIIIINTSKEGEPTVQERIHRLLTGDDNPFKYIQVYPDVWGRATIFEDGVDSVTCWEYLECLEWLLNGMHTTAQGDDVVKSCLAAFYEAVKQMPGALVVTVEHGTLDQLNAFTDGMMATHPDAGYMHFHAYGPDEEDN